VHQTWGRELWGTHQRTGRTGLRGSPGLGIRGFCCDLCTQTTDVLTFTHNQAGEKGKAKVQTLQTRVPQ